MKVVRMTKRHPHPPLRVGLSRWRERRNLYMLSMAIACNCSCIAGIPAIHGHRLHLLLHCRQSAHCMAIACNCSYFVPLSRWRT